MSDYKATPAQWQQIENSQVFNGSFQACVLELRSRVEKLELGAGIYAAVSEAVEDTYTVKPANYLVTRAIRAIKQIWEVYDFEDDKSISDLTARAVIREVANWMREEEGDYSMIRWLEMEIDE